MKVAVGVGMEVELPDGAIRGVRWTLKGAGRCAGQAAEWDRTAG